MDLIRFIFACFGIFANTIYLHHSLQNVRSDSYTNIWFDAKNKYVAGNIRFRANICWRFSHTGEYLLQNICLEANIRKTLSELHIQVNFRLQTIAYKQTSEYSLYVASNYLEKPFISLKPQLIFGSFLKYSLRKEYSFRFYSSHMNTPPIRFDAKQINIRFIFACICLEPNIAALPSLGVVLL